MANVSKLFHGSNGEACFLKNLNIDDHDRANLMEARETVRNCLRRTFATLTKQELGVRVHPRFFTQGSYAYHTINDPCWTPPQQMDLDDGAYLPMTFVKGAQRPSVAADAFFKVVDAALEKLAEAEGWKFARKPTCARLVISSNAHIDVPLYAIPDAEFERLEKQMRTFDGMARDAARADSADRWEELPSDCVLLAHREMDWISSDPRKIHDWFREAIKIYDQVLRRSCRYLKAWRDHHRPHLDDVSSILLMVCAFEAFEDIGRPNVPGRDDLALLRIAERLPRLLAGPVYNPSDRDERVDARLTDASRRIAIDMAKKLDADLTDVIEKCYDPDEAVRRLTALFGDRIPDRADLVDVTRAARAEVRSHEPRITPAPMVGKSTSA
ncbi:CBASS cGAMP synthase [Bradyrhizobium sp. RT4b]|uniref:CBASS cGAMP synthase n=1 Tax=Bradyrhizobium sp. RT4b TaxID=3156379 RepID=UPI00339387B8